MADTESKYKLYRVLSGGYDPSHIYIVGAASGSDAIRAALDQDQADEGTFENGAVSVEIIGLSDQQFTAWEVQ